MTARCWTGGSLNDDFPTKDMKSEHLVPSGHPQSHEEPLALLTLNPTGRTRWAWALVLLTAGLCCLPEVTIQVDAVEPARTLSIVTDPEPGRATQHGLGELADAIRARGWTVQVVSSASAATGPRRILASTNSGGRLTVPESLSITRSPHSAGLPLLSLLGADDRGLMFALLDTAERVGWAKEDADPLSEVREITEQPAVRDRALSVYTMNRAHWESRFYDEAYWARYFDMLAANRFNRFLIIFGYENGGFLAPPYPYFFNTPGFDGVRMNDLTPEQQRRNLAALNRLIELAHDRGLHVTLGIWDHIFRGGVQNGGAEWVRDYADGAVPNAVNGVTAENLNAYTLASLKELLARVPALDSLQFRMHGESGLKRSEMDNFWRAVFELVQKEKPGMLVEARAKGTPDSVIESGLELGVNLRIGTKYWMEQMGLPFHPTHVNPPNQHDRRHGYADLLRYPQRYPMNWRLWNAGTTRVLLWGDPEYVRRYSASTALYDSPNWEVQEPLATKMEAQRPDMPVFDLMPEQYRHYDYEFERYWHFYQVWGRVGYNPATSPEVWQREFQRRFGPAGPHLGAGLHRASQVLPMIVASVYPYRLFPTTRGWAERQSLGASLAEYAKNETTDLQQFESFADAARRILAKGTTTRRTPDATSRWFDATADDILASVRAAESAAGSRRDKEFDATVTDLKILAQLARFHARRSLAAVHYNLFQQGKNKAELAAAIHGEREAVAAWRELVAVAGDRYAPDLAMGARNHNLCGHWRDELKALEAGLKDLEALVEQAGASQGGETVWEPAAVDPADLPRVEHTRPETVPPGGPLRLTVKATAPGGIATVRLRYRHVTQFEDYEALEMTRMGDTDEFAATVPGDFLVPQWDFMYFIEATARAGHGIQWPDLAQEAPYVVIALVRD
jgi:hypothetical protein